ncbi:MAG: ComEA family DNA-binding protein [Kofleriaceae bacterium]
MRYATLGRAAVTLVGLFALFAAMDGTWMTAATAAPPAQLAVKASADEEPPKKKRPVTGKLNLNTATEEQLMMLPTVGPSKAERIVTWRKKNGGFKRTADIRRVKGFGYKTYKKLEPLLAVTGETTLAAK